MKDVIHEIGEHVVEEAEYVFERCGVASDFAIQGGNVFGSVNRIIWTARTGFEADRFYCTDSFLEAFDKWKGVK